MSYEHHHFMVKSDECSTLENCNRSTAALFTQSSVSVSSGWSETPEWVECKPRHFSGLDLFCGPSFNTYHRAGFIILIYGCMKPRRPSWRVISPSGAAVHPAANVMFEGRDSIDDDADDASLEAHPSRPSVACLL